MLLNENKIIVRQEQEVPEFTTQETDCRYQLEIMYFFKAMRKDLETLFKELDMLSLIQILHNLYAYWF